MNSPPVDFWGWMRLRKKNTLKRGLANQKKHINKSSRDIYLIHTDVKNIISSVYLQQPYFGALACNPYKLFSKNVLSSLSDPVLF